MGKHTPSCPEVCCSLFWVTSIGLTTYLCPEQYEHSLRFLIMFLYDPLKYYPPIHSSVFRNDSFLHIYKYCPVYVFLFSTMPATFAVHLILLDLITLTWCDNE